MTGTLVIAQVLVWLVVNFYYRNDDWLEYALVPRAFSLPRLAISPFIHVHPYHLGFNLAVLWLFGRPLERSIGGLRFFTVYLCSAWFAGLMHWAVTAAAQMDLDLTAANAKVGAVGASGAIAGVLGAYCVRLPHQPVRIPLIKKRVPVAPVLGIWLAWELGQAITSTARGTGAGVGHWAHFGGFICGLVLAQLMALQRPAKAEGLRQLSEAAMRSSDYLSAADLFQEILRSNPDDLDAREQLARTRLLLDDLPGAEAAAQEGLARALRCGQSGEAVQMFVAFRELLPEMHLPPGMRYRIGCWLADQGRHREAVVTLMEAAHEDEATPAAAGALFRAGEIAADRLGDPRRARLAWQRILLDYSESAWRDRAYARLSQLSGR